MAFVPQIPQKPLSSLLWTGGHRKFVMDTLFGNLDSIAIERLRTFAPGALEKRDAGYYVAYSGGKDSDVILDLVRRSGVKYTAHYHVTTCDPPEVIKHIRTRLEVIFEQPPMTMWQLIKKKGMPPRRNRRFCCEKLKEGRGIDAMVVTGVRWEESSRRRSRRMIETCFRHKEKRFLNVIIDWTSTDVWNYLRQRKISYCSLYDEGFKRLGCVLCPMTRDVERQIQRWPHIARKWENAVKATFKPEKSGFRSAEDLWLWWLDRDSHAKQDDKQLMFFTD